MHNENNALGCRVRWIQSPLDAESKSSDWSGEYATNDGQRVSANDAAALADACERVLSDPDYEARTLTLLDLYNAAVAEQVPSYTPEPAKRDDVVKFRERLAQVDRDATTYPAMAVVTAGV